jgi:hypothetical protein
MIVTETVVIVIEIMAVTIKIGIMIVNHQGAHILNETTVIAKTEIVKTKMVMVEVTITMELVEAQGDHHTEDEVILPTG